MAEAAPAPEAQSAPARTPSPEEHFTTEPIGGGCKITGYTGPGGDVVIPHSVTSISRSAFRNCTALTSVVIPDGATEIDMYAFYGCPSLTLRVPEGSDAHQYAINHAIPFELI